MLCRGGTFEGVGLQWFDLSSDHGIRGSAEGIVRCQIEAQVPASIADAGASCTFSVECAGQGNLYRELFLRAPDHEGMLQWVRVIQRSIASDDWACECG